MVGDDEEPGGGAPRHLVQKVAEPAHVGVVQGRVHFVQHADRGGVGEEHGEDQRHRGQRLLAPRQQRQGRQLLARGLAHDFQARVKRVVGFDHHQPRLAAAEQEGEQRAEVRVHGVEGGQQPLAPLAVQPRDAAAQLADRGGQFVTLGGEGVALFLQRALVLVGAQVHRADRIALHAQAGDPVVQRGGVGDGGRVQGQAVGKVGGGAARVLGDAGAGGGFGCGGGVGAGFLCGAALARV